MADNMFRQITSAANSSEEQAEVQARNITLPTSVEHDEGEAYLETLRGQSLSSKLHSSEKASGSPQTTRSSEKRSYIEINEHDVNASLNADHKCWEATHHHEIGQKNVAVLPRGLMSVKSRPSTISDSSRRKIPNVLQLLLKKFNRFLRNSAGKNKRRSEKYIRMLKKLKFWKCLRTLSLTIDDAQEESMTTTYQLGQNLQQSGAQHFQGVVEWNQREAENVSRQLSEARILLTSQQDENKALKRSQQDLEKDIEDEQKAKVKLEIKKNEYKMKSTELANEICEVKTNLATANNDYGALKKDYLALKEKYEARQDAIIILKGQNSEHLKSHTRLQDQYDDLFMKYSEQQGKTKDIATDYHNINVQNHKLSQNCTELDRRAKQLQQEVEIEREQASKFQSQVAALKNEFAASQHTEGQTSDAQIAQLMKALFHEVSDWILNNFSDIEIVSPTVSDYAAEFMSANARELAARDQLDPTYMFFAVVWQHLLKFFEMQNYLGGNLKGATIARSAAQFIGTLRLNDPILGHSEKDWLKKTIAMIHLRADIDVEAEQDFIKTKIGTEMEGILASAVGFRLTKPQKEDLESILTNVQSLAQILWQQDDPYYISMFPAPKGEALNERFEASIMEDVDGYEDVECTSEWLVDLFAAPILAKRVIDKKNNASEVTVIVKAKVYFAPIVEPHQRRETPD